MSSSLYTIGHSNRDIQHLVDLLKRHHIHTLVDIRSNPVSARHPQFNQDVLRSRLETENMIYHWAGRQLGGLRKTSGTSRHHALAPELQGFAEYMETQEFERAASQLQRLASQSPIAIMCAEKHPEHCHRSLIADYLLLNGMEVMHIIDEQPGFAHQLRPEARRESAALIYDRVTRNTSNH